MMIKAILFDLDDTLFDHAHSARASIAVSADRWPALAALGSDEMLARFQRILRETHPARLAGTITPEASRKDRLYRLLATVGVDPTEADVEEILQAQVPVYRKVRRPVPGSIEVLTSLRRQGISIGIVSNNFVREQVEKIEVCGLAPLVDSMTISEEAGHIKPAPEIFHIALRRLGVEAGATRMVGDSWEADIRGALAAGIEPVWFNPAGAPAPDPGVRHFASFQPHDAVLELLLRG